MRAGRASVRVLRLVMAALAATALARGASAQTVEAVTFPTNVVGDLKPVTLSAELHLPAGNGPFSAVVITPSSGGESTGFETYYARELAKAGIAALSVHSFSSRGLKSSVENQSVLPGWHTENDAIGALRWLSADRRFRPDRIGITGVSKGGQAALNTAFLVRRRWARVGDLQFAAHAPIAPPCNAVMQTKTTTDKPIFFMLAEFDDQGPAIPCVNLANDMRRAGNLRVDLKVYEGAHHAWEKIGARPYFDPKAENYRNCRGSFDDNGRYVPKPGEVIEPRDTSAYMKRTCVKLGTHCCGGNEALKAEATRDLIAFFRRSGL